MQTFDGDDEISMQRTQIQSLKEKRSKSVPPSTSLNQSAPCNRIRSVSHSRCNRKRLPENQLPSSVVQSREAFRINPIRSRISESETNGSSDNFYGSNPRESQTSHKRSVRDSSSLSIRKHYLRTNKNSTKSTSKGFLAESDSVIEIQSSPNSSKVLTRLPFNSKNALSNNCKADSKLSARESIKDGCQNSISRPTPISGHSKFCHIRSVSSKSQIRSSNDNVEMSQVSKTVSFSPSCENNESEVSRTNSHHSQFSHRNSLLKHLSSMKSSHRHLPVSSRLSHFVDFVKSSRHSGFDTPRKRIGHEYLMTKIDDSIYEHIFSFLSANQVKQCSYVCKLWMRICMPRLGGIVIFDGKGRVWPTKRENDKLINKFLKYIREKEEKFRHPYKIRFMDSTEPEIQKLVGLEYSDRFRLCVRHMTHVNFSDCQLRWKTFLDLLLHFENLKTLYDENSCHYSFQNRLFNVSSAQTSVTEILNTNNLNERGLAKVKSVKIIRKTISQETVNYIALLRGAVSNLHEFSLILGDCEIQNQQNSLASEVDIRDLTEFITNLRLFFITQAKNLKKISFRWNCLQHTDLFSRCMETLKHMHGFSALSELTLAFDKDSMKTPKHLNTLMNFLRTNFHKVLRIFRLSVIVLGLHWKDTVNGLEDLVTDNSFRTNLELGIELNDSYGESGSVLNKKFLSLYLFVIYTTNLSIHVENQKTVSLSEFLPQEISKHYLRVKKLNISFAPGEEFQNFTNFNMDTIAHNFPNLTELFIQDEGERKNSTTREKRSAAMLGDKEIQIISAVLVKLKVLRVWTDLNNLTDYGITGICPEEIFSLQSNHTRSKTGVKRDLRSCFSSLSEIREISLRGVGKGVTSISARYGFEDLTKLQYLEIIGAFKISRAAKRVLYNKIRKYDPECVLKLSSY